LKIAVYAISLNEEKFIERFYNSAKAADIIILADTGSTDATVKIAKKLGIKTYSIAVNPWRFDTARNAALALIPLDVDVCISVDVDEVMLPGWREVVESTWDENITRMQYRFDNGGGNIFNATKIHKRTGYSWRNLCHEMIEIDPRLTETWAVSNDVLIAHHPDPTKSRGQYLPMLLAATKEDPYSYRNAWYLAREYWYHKQHEQAVAEWDRYLAMPGATWHHERSFALRHKAKSLMALGKTDSAKIAYRQAIDCSPDLRENWMELAQACYELNHWRECYYAATTGLDISNREWIFTCDPSAWGWRLDDLAAISAWNLGLYDSAIHHGEKAVSYDPTNERLSANLTWYKSIKAEKEEEYAST
jgi:tetratricopeptide (TPR) repeat protein